MVRIPHIADKLLLADEKGRIPFFTKPIAYDAYAWWLLKDRLVLEALPAFRFERLFFFEKTAPLCLRITAIWENVMERITSTESDRPVLIMSLLGLDLFPVLDIPARKEGNAPGGAIDRMRVVYKSLPEFPQDMIFQHGKRFDEYGMRWAVTTCSKDTGDNQLPRRLSDIPGRVQERGLCVEYPALLVSGLEGGWKLSYGLWMKFSGLRGGGNTLALAALVHENNQDLAEGHLGSETQIGIIVESEDELEDLICDKRTTVNTAVVELLEKENGVQYCKFLGRLHLSKMPAIEAVLHNCLEAKYITAGAELYCIG